MNEINRFKPASQQEMVLYTLIGESVCAVQHVEDALSHSIVLKKARPQLKSEADQLLEKHRSYTLGKAVKIAEKDNLYSESIMQELKEFLSERNWLIHKIIAQSRDGWDLNIERERLFYRIKAVTTHAQRLMASIEKDLIVFSEANGVDMSRVRAELKKCYE